MSSIPKVYTAIDGKADVLCTLDRDFYEPEVVAFCQQRGGHSVAEYTVEDLDREAASSRPVWERRQMELAGEAKDESRRAR
ncbi:MAG: hypothetical protein ABSA59_21525 [Terriglobia bacterium]